MADCDGWAAASSRKSGFWQGLSCCSLVSSAKSASCYCYPRERVWSNLRMFDSCFLLQHRKRCLWIDDRPWRTTFSVQAVRLTWSLSLDGRLWRLKCLVCFYWRDVSHAFEELESRKNLIVYHQFVCSLGQYCAASASNSSSWRETSDSLPSYIGFG